MRDRYTDDVGQFLKVALMRWLVSPSPFGQGHRLGVIWLQEPGGLQPLEGDHLARLDGTHDVDEDENLRSLDPDLYDRLRVLEATYGRPMSARQTCGALPSDTIRFDRPLRFDDLLRDDRAARAVSRQRWFHEAMVAVSACSVVFVDSDPVADRHEPQPVSTDPADDGICISEIGRMLERGQSVVTHQITGPSMDLADLAEAHMSGIHDALGVESLTIAQESDGFVRLFTVFPHQRHRSDLQNRIGALQLSRWADEFHVYRWRSDLVTA